MSAPDFLAIGHITRDLLADASTTPGGTALYASCVAARLGLRAAVLTAGKQAAGSVEPGVEVHCVPSGVDTTFENTTGPAGRMQRLHAVAPRLGEAALTPELRRARLVLLGPVADEVDPALAWAFEGARVAATPQGWMRAWGEPLPSAVARRPFEPPPGLLGRLSLLVLSVEDVGGDESIAAALAASCPLVALTRGSAGATLFIEGKPTPVAPHPAHERDATGAGDVFAAALLVRLGEGADPLAAARFAARVAAASVEGPGTSAIPEQPTRESKRAPT